MAGLCTINNLAVDEDLTVSGERKGSKSNILLTVSAAGFSRNFRLGGVLTGSGKKSSRGFVAPRAGNITAMSISYEVTIANVANSTVSVLVAGVAVTTMSIDVSSVDILTDFQVESRGSNKFSQGDLISASFAGVATLDELILNLEIILDD